jgi:N-acetyl-anhydromuramyl-L-alanine amidase AmpD
MRIGVRLLGAVGALLLLVTSAYAGGTEFPPGDRLDGPLGRAFAAAAREFGVPPDLLVAVAYSESHLNAAPGPPGETGSHGLMGLREGSTLEEAAGALGLESTGGKSRLTSDPVLNIRGGAAVLARYARQTGGGRLPADLAGWAPALARYSGLRDAGAAASYARQVLGVLARGLDVAAGSEFIRLEPRPVVLPPAGGIPGSGGLGPGGLGLGAGVDAGVVGATAAPGAASADYPPARWIPANPLNFTPAARPASDPIRYIVIHVTQGSYASAIDWFQNPRSRVSAHYVIRSSDGEVTQLVREQDIAWHAGNWTYNTQSIGIEHEGFVNDCSWFTEAMYQSSAALTRALAARYAIPLDRQHIIGHVEVPGATHTDPGPCWDWAYYMQLVTGDQHWSTVVEATTPGRVRFSGNWDWSAWNSQRHGSAYLYTTPRAISDAAYYRVAVPAAGEYDIYTWYPSNPGYNGATPVVIWQDDGAGGLAPTVVRVDQRSGGGRWVFLGTFRLPAGDRELIAVSRWSSAPGFIMADAFKVVQR